jgi:hypothetical protein
VWDSELVQLIVQNDAWGELCGHCGGLADLIASYEFRAGEIDCPYDLPINRSKT